MKAKILYTLTTLLLGLTLLPAPGAAVEPPHRSGCRADIYSTWLSNRNKAISCTRSQAHQNAIRAHFIRLGRYGQAGKTSRHVAGCACDFTTRALSNRHGLWLNKRTHTGNHLSDNGH